MTVPPSNRKEEQILIAGCVKGEPDRWAEFVEQYGRLIGKTAATLHWKYGKGVVEVEDLVAYVYEKLLEDECRRLRAWRGQSRFSTYLVRVTTNLCIDQLKRPRREVSLDEVGDVPALINREEEPEGVEWKQAQVRALQQAIATLTPKRSMIMQLRLKGVPLRDIAAIMGLPEGTVFVESSRAISKLRKIMDVSVGPRGTEKPTENSGARKRGEEKR